MSSGVEKAWEALAEMTPESVRENALARHDAEGSKYIVLSLGMDFAVSPGERKITGLSAESEALRARLAYYFDISILWYLSCARAFGATGRLVRPGDLKGGHHFFTGTHELPLGKLAERYGSDREAFLRRAGKLGGEPLAFGDASARLLPLPRVPVVLILWLGDEEFPPRADLLLDSSAELQLPLDVIWSVAMMSVLAML